MGLNLEQAGLGNCKSPPGLAAEQAESIMSANSKELPIAQKALQLTSHSPSLLFLTVLSETMQKRPELAEGDYISQLGSS